MKGFALALLARLAAAQLGGGTDIGKAVGYCADLVTRPARTLLVLITDLYEGRSPSVLLSRVQRLVESGVTVTVLAALDDRGEPDYNRDLGRALAALGARVGAMTPRELVRFIGEALG